MKMNRRYLMASAIVAVMILFILLELAKLLILPALGAMQSHLITLVFVTILVSASAYLVHRIDLLHHCQMNKKQLETAKLGQALLVSEDRYRAIFENSTNSIVLMDCESWETVDFNKKACEMLACSRMEFSKYTLKDYEVLPFKEIKKRLERMALTGLSETYETRYRKKNGGVIDVLVNTENLSIGGRKYYLLISDDITEKKRIQTRAIEQYEFLNTLMETIPSPVFYKDRQGKYIGCNKAFEEFFGMTRRDMLDKAVHETSLVEIAEEFLKKEEELFENQSLQVYEGKVKTKRLGLRDVVFSKAAFNDIKGDVAGIIGVIQDITDRKKAEHGLQQSRDALLEHNRILLAWTSPELICNPDFEDIVANVTETVAGVVKVERVSLWLFNTDFSKLYCTELFEKKKGRRSDDTVLDVLKYPSYFLALRNERVIVSNNALADPRYAELLDDYIKPNGIYSTLDVPVFVAGEIIGVICIEHQAEPREWTVEEQNFAISVGNVFSLILEISRHKELEKSIRSAKENFLNIVEKLPYPILIIDMKGTVKYVNTTCESFFGPKVKDMLGSQFPYPLPSASSGRMDFIRPDGSGDKVELVAVKTRWDREEARLISLYEHSPI